MAVDAGAQDSASGQGAVADAIKQQNAAIKGSGENFPELAEPHLVMASPAGIELSSAASIHLAASDHVALTSGKDIALASGHSLFASVAHSLRLFAHKAGMKLIAASGKIAIEAHNDEVDMIARKVLSLISEADWVNIKGKKASACTAPTTCWKSATKCSFLPRRRCCSTAIWKPWRRRVCRRSSMKGPMHSFDQAIRLMEVDGKPAANIAFELIRDDGNKISDTSTADGRRRTKRRRHGQLHDTLQGRTAMSDDNDLNEHGNHQGEFHQDCRRLGGIHGQSDRDKRYGAS